MYTKKQLIKALIKQFPFLKVRKELLRSLTSNPNPSESGFELLEQINKSLREWGLAYLWAVHNQFGIPVELYLLETSKMLPILAAVGDAPLKYYRQGSVTEIDQKQILKIGVGS